LSEAEHLRRVRRRQYAQEQPGEGIAQLARSTRAQTGGAANAARPPDVAGEWAGGGGDYQAETRAGLAAHSTAAPRPDPISTILSFSLAVPVCRKCGVWSAPTALSTAIPHLVSPGGGW